MKMLLISAALLASLALSGCTALSSNAPQTVQGSAISGRAYGGQQPIAYGTVQLYAAGSSGYGSASTALITPASASTAYPVQTDANGNFNITGKYACPTPASTPVYITVTGGNPVANTPNPNLALMAALGPCSALDASTFVNVNEVTTVASVWALSPFMSAIDRVGTSTGNALGLSNAFAAVKSLVNIATGTVPGPALPTGATLPVDEINALADILSACINSAGGTAGDGSNCGALFQDATPGATAPVDTVTAAMNIAQNPTLNVAALFAQVPSAGAVFATNLAQPAAWSLIINYTGGGLSAPRAVANDASGNVWVANAGNNSVSKLSSTGVALSEATGFTAGNLSTPSALAVDATGNVWVANSGNASLTLMNSAGTYATVYNGNGLNAPASLAMDSMGNVWVANNGSSSVSVFTSSGNAIGNYTGGGIIAPVAIAVDPE
jgi:hypothetical protein